MNLFATILTNAAPSANYRGESAQNRAVIQKITRGRFEYPIISPEAIRNALRETLRVMGLPCNRTRLDDEEQLAVKFDDYPDADAYADDFFMGWLITAKSDEKQTEILKKDPDKLVVAASEKITKGKANKLTRHEILACLQSKKRDVNKFSFKRDSIIRMNMAVALEPYRHNSVFTQSPMNVGSPWANAESSQLLHRETCCTAFQYPLALNLNDCECRLENCSHQSPSTEPTCKRHWTLTLLSAIGQLNEVAGNHARSYFEMAPASLVVRLTDRLACGYNSYGFENKEGKHIFPEVVDGILHGKAAAEADYPGDEFFIGGKIVKDMSEKMLTELSGRGVTINRSPERLLETVAARVFPRQEA